MSLNKFVPHVLVLPEDDANRQIAVGFQLEIDWVTRMKILPVAGGWTEVVHRFATDHALEIEKNENRLMILLIDFDGKDDRLDKVRASVPSHLIERVFVVGAWTNPEHLRQALNESYETIGSRLSQDCRNGTTATWNHDLLRHNEDELGRLRGRVRSIFYV